MYQRPAKLAFVLLLLGLILPGAAPSDGPDPTTARASHGGEVHSCGGQAPEVVHCTTGEHRADLIFFHAFTGEKPDAATLESRVVHANGAHSFRCDYLAGDSLGCVMDGEPIPIFGTVTHECFSYVLFSATVPLGGDEVGAPAGLPGGVGPWACVIST